MMNNLDKKIKAMDYIKIEFLIFCKPSSVSDITVIPETIINVKDKSTWLFLHDEN